MSQPISFKELNEKVILYLKSLGIKCDLVPCYQGNRHSSPLMNHSCDEYVALNDLHDDDGAEGKAILFADGRVLYSDSLFNPESGEIIHPLPFDECLIREC
ncbi:hypothetical protein [Acinetobacter variabilis]|uniref:hypothetical protein n=1 Tax=Acinetobacter variabilis TaxID=70346 RepID=UPI00289CC920|nr:hypothetical protein [Acinetobacter variabilis]